MTRLRRSLCLLGLAAACGGPAAVRAQTPPDTDSAAAMLAELSPEERVGQLFLVAYFEAEGSDTAPGPDVQRLVTHGRIGGVVLLANSGTIANAPGSDGPARVRQLTGALQALAVGPDGSGVPLFVAVDHEGDGAPRTHLREGFTALPSAMAIGATWDPASAEAVGAIVGAELAGVGVNLLLGPVLDVLAEPRITQRGDMGVRSFGGDPYWVGRLGAATIRGVHRGSRGRVATVAKHFPGHGGSDRLPDTEVATVNKSVDELRRIELPPFQTVTDGPPASDDAITDALMTSHIRYRGFQGNIRDTTPPISLSADALGQALASDPATFGRWRAGGGLIVADSLGVRALKRYDDPSEQTFNHRRIARDALLAGNDVLILAEFAVGEPGRLPWSRQMANIEDTLAYFAAEYRRDPEFRARVDDAAGRVLARKRALVPGDWSAAGLAAPAAPLEGAPDPVAVVRGVARAAVTRLRGDDVEPPRPDERVVVVTDGTGTLACRRDTCGLGTERLRAILANGPTLVEGLLVDRFVPAGRVRPENVAALDFCTLQSALLPENLQPPPAAATPDGGGNGAAEPTAAGSETPTAGDAGACPPNPDRAATLATLTNADWIVFAYTDLNRVAVPHAEVVENFLQLAGGLVDARRLRLAAVSLGTPYTFETTDFNKLDVFLAAYSKIPASIEAALDALYGELEPAGSAPVSVESAHYDLAAVLEPDPDRVLPLALLAPADPAAARAPAPYRVRVGPVLDSGGRPVPDGTSVEVRVEGQTGEAASSTSRGTTREGVADIEGVLRDGGRLRLVATSGEAASEALAIVLPQPTPTPTRAAPTAAPLAEEGAAAPSPPAGARLGVPDFLVALAAVVLVVAMAVGRPGWRRQDPIRRLRGPLLAAAGGWLGYLTLDLALGLGWIGRGASAVPHLDTAAAVAAGALAAAAAERAVERATARIRRAPRAATR